MASLVAQMSVFVSLGGNWQNLLLFLKFIEEVNEKSLINLLPNNNICHKDLHNQPYFTNMWNQPEIITEKKAWEKPSRRLLHTSQQIGNM